MKYLMLLLSLMISANAFADSVVCSISSGQESESVTLDLNQLPGAADDAYTQGIYDLGFNMGGDCEDESCEVYATINSQMAEDEVGQIGFTVTRNGQDAVVLDEPLTNSRDGRDYQLVCEYKK